MSAHVGYSLGPLTPDQIDFIHSLGLHVLLAAANSQVNLNVLATQELANRGYDRLGRWVGYRLARDSYMRGVEPAPPCLLSDPHAASR